MKKQKVGERESEVEAGGLAEENLRLPGKSILTLARVALGGDSEARGTSTSEAAQDVVARVRAGRRQGALVLI